MYRVPYPETCPGPHTPIAPPIWAATPVQTSGSGEPRTGLGTSVHPCNPLAHAHPCCRHQGCDYTKINLQMCSAAWRNHMTPTLKHPHCDRKVHMTKVGGTQDPSPIHPIPSFSGMKVPSPVHFPSVERAECHPTFHLTGATKREPGRPRP